MGRHLRIICPPAFWAAAILLMVSVVASRANSLHDAPDIPLPDQAIEKLEAGTSFDTAQGRILTAYASRPSGLDDAAITQFYRQSLPNLGWSLSAQELSFRRLNEQLLIRLTTEQIIFNLTPLSANNE